MEFNKGSKYNFPNALNGIERNDFDVLGPQ
jgi:hypothetical protein